MSHKFHIVRESSDGSHTRLATSTSVHSAVHACAEREVRDLQFEAMEAWQERPQDCMRVSFAPGLFVEAGLLPAVDVDDVVRTMRAAGTHVSDEDQKAARHEGGGYYRVGEVVAKVSETREWLTWHIGSDRHMFEICFTRR